MDSIHKIAETLRNGGYKATTQRIAIAQTILRSSDHPSAEEIHENVLRHHPTISLSTVYNTLHILRDMNFINEIMIKGKTRYDSNPDMHVNLVCEACGRIFDVEEITFFNDLEKISKRLGFRIKGQHIDVYGICSSCFNILK